LRKMQPHPDEGIRPDPATYPHGDFGCHLRMGPRRIPIRLRIRTAIPFPIRAGEGKWQPGTHGRRSLRIFRPATARAGRSASDGFPSVGKPPLPGKRPPEKRSLRGSWRQTTRSFAKEPAVNISIATDAAGSALPSKGKKKSEAIRSLAGRFVHPPITAAGPFPCPAQKVRTKMFVQNPAPSPGSTIFRRWNSFAPASFYTYSWTSSRCHVAPWKCFSMACTSPPC